MQLAGRHLEQGLQATVAVHAQSLVMFTAVGLSNSAGMTLLAVDVGLNAAAITGKDVFHLSADGYYFDPEFVAGNPRVAEKRHLSKIAAIVGATDAYRLNADNHLTRPGRGRLGHIDQLPMFRFDKLQCLHHSASVETRIVHAGRPIASASAFCKKPVLCQS